MPNSNLSASPDAAICLDDERSIRQSLRVDLAVKNVGFHLSNAGLPPDYQMIPMLNFRNIASEQEGEKSLKLLDDVYKQVSSRVNAFLDPDEIIFRNSKISPLRTMVPR